MAPVQWRFVFAGVVRTFTLLCTLYFIPLFASWSPLLVLVLGVPLVASFLSRGTAFYAWAVYLLGFVAFASLRSYADGTGVTWRYDYAIMMDEFLGAGVLPTVRLQHAIDSRVFDWTMIFIYISFFVVPATVGAALWLRKRDLRRYVIAALVIYAVGLIVQFLVPTAPPWLASAKGLTPGIERIILDVAYPAAPQLHTAGYLASPNDVAAMPSVHLAITVLASLGAASLGRPLVTAGAAYTVLMVLSIVYLGEHYLIDAIAGAVLGLLAWQAAGSVRVPIPRP